ncbi:hypothetical protein FXB39_01565 [Nocardioides sp. BGMRC 2183]|nr:hypothetical protein FXB39_01565 [Nocardioides sp. BGMRC 2183]
MTGPDPTQHPPEGRPSWLAEACPPWCAREHHEQDHPEDRYHQSAPSFAPVIAALGHAIPVTDALTAVELIIRMARYVGDVHTWIAIEGTEAPEPRLVLTAESARSLVQHLEEQLDSLRLP